MPGGVWYYTDTPAIAGSLWIGAESARSAAVTTDSQAPTVVATGSPAANANGWNNANVTLTLTATDEAGGSGVKSISYAVDGGSTVTVNGSSTGIALSTDGTPHRLLLRHRQWPATPAARRPPRSGSTRCCRSPRPP